MESNTSPTDIFEQNNIDASYVEIKADVFLKLCQNPPDYVGIFRIIEEQTKKISVQKEIQKENAITVENFIKTILTKNS
jgi:hypothetical protein